MSNMCVKVEFMAGTTVEEAVQEAKHKAQMWRVAYLEFDFNGVEVSVRADSDLEGATDKVIEAMGKDHKFVIL